MTKTLIPAVGYARRSTDMQERSIPDQQAAVERWAAEHGYRVLRWYIDDAVSGTSARGRDAFEQMLKAAENGRDFETVLCYDISRFSRGGTNETGFYLHRLHLAGVGVVFTADGIPEGDEGELIQGVKSWQARQYSVKLARDSIRGQLSNLRERKSAPGGQPPYGYDKQHLTPGGQVLRTLRWLPYGSKQEFGPDGRLLRVVPAGVNLKKTKSDIIRYVPSLPERVAVVKRMFDLCVQGYGFHHIAQTFNAEGIPSPGGQKWNTARIAKLIRNPVYRGAVIWNRHTMGSLFGLDGQGGLKPKRKKMWQRNTEADWIISEDVHEALVSKDTWAAAQRAVAKRRAEHGNARPTKRTLLAGLLVCKRCGNPFTTIRDRRWPGPTGEGYRVYACSGYHRYGKTVCRVVNVPGPALDRFVLDAVRKVLLGDHATVEKAVDAFVKAVLAPRAKAKPTRGDERELDLLNRKIKATVSMLADPSFDGLDELRTTLADLKAKRDVLEARLKPTDEPARPAITEADLRAWAMEQFARLDELATRTEIDLKDRQMVAAFIQKIEIDPDAKTGTVYLHAGLADAYATGSTRLPGGDFMGAFEIAFYGWKEGAGHLFLGPNNVTDLWHVKKVNPQSMIHLTEKPVELAVRAMQYSSREGEHVLDLFGGSGSTLIAAEQTGRKAFLMELDPLYSDVIVARWEQFTGRKAERIAALEKSHQPQDEQQVEYPGVSLHHTRPRSHVMTPFVWPFGFLFLSTALVLAADPPKSKLNFPLSRDTTYITEPLDQEGYLDFETALNERLRGKTKPQTNAVVVMLEICGPKPQGVAVHSDFYRWLGVKEPPEDGDYFVDLEKYRLKVTGVTTTEEESKQDDALQRMPWTREQYPLIAKWLDANEKPLAQIDRMVARPDYYYPLLSSRDEKGRRTLLIGALLPHVQKCRSLARALNILAMYKIATKEYEAAWKLTIVCQKLGRMVARGGTNIEMLVGQAIFVSAIHTQLTLLERSNSDAKQALAYLRELQSLPPAAPWLDKLQLAERFTVLDSVQSLRRDADKLPGVALPNDPKEREQALDLFRWDVVFRTVMQYYDHYIDTFTPPAPGQLKKRRQLPDIDTELQRLRKQIEANNDVAVNTAKSVGLVTMGLLLPALEKLHNKSIELEQQFANVQLAFALQAYRAEHARYPAKLDDLAPKYFKTVPLDLFSKKPLIYQPKDSGYLLYSVGPNRQDDGGLTMTDTPKGDDLRVQMPMQKDN